MSEANPIAQLRRRLLELGCPPKATRRIVRETAEHYEDLQRAATAQGVTPAAAMAQAAEQLGNPQQLAERHLDALRNSSWLAQHAFFSFGLLPLAAMLGLGGFCWYGEGGKILWADPWHYLSSHAPWIYLWMGGIYWGSFMAVTAGLALYFCCGAQRFAVARKWRWVAGGVLAVHALFVQVKPVQWASLDRTVDFKQEPTTLTQGPWFAVSARGMDWSADFSLYHARLKELRANEGDLVPDEDIIRFVPPGAKAEPGFVLLPDPLAKQKITQSLAEIQQAVLNDPPDSIWKAGWGPGWRVNGWGDNVRVPRKSEVWVEAYSPLPGRLAWRLQVQVPFLRLVYAYAPTFWSGGWQHWVSVLIPLLVVAAMQFWQRRTVNRFLASEEHVSRATPPIFA